MVMIQGDMVALTKTSALRLVRELGFPNPSGRYLLWYFEKYGSGYKPCVDFTELAKEIKAQDLVRQVDIVRHLPIGHNDREKVFQLVKSIVDKHRIN